MKVAIDAQLAVGTATGIGEYVRGLCAALRAAGTDVAELFETRLDPWRFDRRVRWDQIALPQQARSSGAAVLHCASGTMPLRAPLPTVVTVHDVAWLRVQAHARPYARYYFGAFSLKRYRRAAAIAVDSEFSRRELLSLLGDAPPPVTVVYPGVSSDFAALQRGTGDRETILAVGTVEPRKNVSRLVRLLPRLPQARLVVLGPPTPYQEQCAALAQRLRVADRVEFRGYVDRAELLRCYQRTAVVAVPSSYEGFGYAAAQALCAGTPCIVSDAAALREIAGDDAPAVPLDDDDAWTDALDRALSGADDARAAAVRDSAIARFSWTAAARSMQRIYLEALS
jgi:glycosyltransferase involved in cell wall biosynthesis